MDAHPLLFSEYMFLGMKLRNRFVQTPIQTRAADADGYATRELLNWHAACAGETAPGIVIVQQAYAWPAVRLERGLALWDESFFSSAAQARVLKATMSPLLPLPDRGTEKYPGK